MINAAGCGVKSSPSGGALASAARDLAARCAVGSRRGRRWAAESGAGVGGAEFVAQPPPPSCQAEYASITAGQMPGVMDQDLHWSEAWLGTAGASWV